MIPIRDDAQARIAPVVVVALIAANVLVFLYEVALLFADREGAVLAAFMETWGLVPREFLRGATEPRATRNLVWLTPLTAMFIHGGLLHLAGNMLYLWIFGRGVEGLLGHRRFALLYVASGLAAGALQVASAPSSFAPNVGASGAVSGILGAYLVSYPTARLRLLWPSLRVPAALFLLLWIAIQVAAGLDSFGDGEGGVAWWAHIGGFAAGAALGRAMWVRKPSRSRKRI